MLILGVIQALTRWVDVLFHVLGFREYCQTAHCSTLWVFHVQQKLASRARIGPRRRFARRDPRSPRKLAPVIKYARSLVCAGSPDGGPSDRCVTGVACGSGPDGGERGAGERSDAG